MKYSIIFETGKKYRFRYAHPHKDTMIGTLIDVNVKEQYARFMDGQLYDVPIAAIVLPRAKKAK